MYYLYALTHVSSGKVYIGQTKNAQRRKWEHKMYSTNKHLRNAIKLYSWDKFVFEVIDCALNQSQADCIETCLIAHYDSRNKGYNVSSGGYHRELSDEGKASMLAANLGRTPWNKGKAGTYEINREKPYKGWHHSEKTKEQMKNSQTGAKNHAFGKHRQYNADGTWNLVKVLNG
jgi:group I intron endonuclease